MARRRKSSRKNTKCPEPINTFINLGAGLTMGIIAAHQEKKYHYKEKGKINPYTATAIGFATGSIKSHRDILRTGAILGALGSFDVEADDYRSDVYTPEDPVFSQIKENRTNNNQYAWRLNCEDGSAYGVSPNDYETREAYHAELRKRQDSNSQKISVTAPQKYSIGVSKENNDTYVFLRVSRLDNGVNEYYIANEICINVGDIVHIPDEKGNVTGVVLSVEICTKENAPQSPEETRKIL